MSGGTRTAQCRHGVFTYHAQDRFLGTSLRIYGEWSEGEVDLYDSILKPTDTVIEVGANIGALTVPLARRVQQVFSFEPQPENCELLYHNLSSNGISNVEVFPDALGASDDVVTMPLLEEIDKAHGVIGDYGGPEVGYGSLIVKQRALDDVKEISGKIAFIKMDCEGSELQVLQGAESLIARDTPLLYVENDRKDKQEPLIAWLVDHGYECFWHRPPLYRVNNFKNYYDNIFGDCNSKNMICIKGHEIDAKWLTERAA